MNDLDETKKKLHKISETLAEQLSNHLGIDKGTVKNLAIINMAVEFAIVSNRDETLKILKEYMTKI